MSTVTRVNIVQERSVLCLCIDSSSFTLCTECAKSGKADWFCCAIDVNVCGMLTQLTHNASKMQSQSAQLIAMQRRYMAVLSAVLSAVLIDEACGVLELICNWYQRAVHSVNVCAISTPKGCFIFAISYADRGGVDINCKDEGARQIDPSGMQSCW